MIRRTLLLIALAVVLRPGVVAGQLSLPRDLEVTLARSALPEHLRADATVYLFVDGEGYVVAHEGSNGFHAMVSRVEPAIYLADWEYREHFDTVILPIAFDAAGATTSMQAFLDAGELIARGTSPAETKREMRRRYASVYRSPERPGVAFMLSPILRAFPNPTGSGNPVTVSIPHRMFYAPGITNEDIGGLASAFVQPYVIQEGPWGYMVQRAGPEEAGAIRSEYADMLRQLCEIESSLCLNGGAP